MGITSSLREENKKLKVVKAVLEKTNKVLQKMTKEKEKG